MEVRQEGDPIETPVTVKYRKSRIRSGILEILSGMESHPTAEEIHDEIKRRYPSVSYGTVYRNLNILVEQGEAKRIESSRGRDRFDARLPFHAHFRCDACGGLFDIPVDAEELTRGIEQRTGHRIEGRSIDFHGVCASCSRGS